MGCWFSGMEREQITAAHATMERVREDRLRRLGDGPDVGLLRVGAAALAECLTSDYSDTSDLRGDVARA